VRIGDKRGNGVMGRDVSRRGRGIRDGKTERFLG